MAITGAMLSDLMTPGFHSSKPETWASRKNKQGAETVPIKSEVGKWVDSELAKAHVLGLLDAVDAGQKERDSKILEEFNRFRKEKGIEVSDDNGLAAELAALDDDDTLKTLAGNVTSMFSQVKNPTAFMLGSPASLTVKMKDESYSKRPHIGGEYFIPIAAYAGKKGSLIYVFKCSEVTNYSFMEMSESQAHTMLQGFEPYMKDAFSHGLTQQIRDAKVKAAKEAELADNAKKFEQYADLGFGTF
jgi:hypothetical protein